LKSFGILNGNISPPSPSLLEDEEVVEWSHLSTPEGKFEYAAFVGRYSHLLRTTDTCTKVNSAYLPISQISMSHIYHNYQNSNYGHTIQQAFPSCPTSFAHVTRVLSTKSSCLPAQGLRISETSKTTRP